jgi:D-alanyl-D-alanine dipeptidase
MIEEKPGDFIYVQDIVPHIVIDMAYAHCHNFIGSVIDGYLAPTALLTYPAAKALLAIQQKLLAFNLKLKLFDAYRPQQAVDHFVRWSQDEHDICMKQEFYPTLTKAQLFSEGYIVKKSSHSRGSTVDLTITDNNGNELDMGTRFDFFGPQSWPTYLDLTPTQCANRLLLRNLMIAHGFTPFATEWWHFTLTNEPYRDTYFNFAVI